VYPALGGCLLRVLHLTVNNNGYSSMLLTDIDSDLTTCLCSEQCIYQLNPTKSGGQVPHDDNVL